jgi:transposase
MMGTIKKTYTLEFKQEAVRLVSQGDVTVAQGARDLGLNYHMLARWKRESEAKGERAFPGKGNAQQDEMDRLQRENEILRQERDILKKAVGIFSQRPR